MNYISITNSMAEMICRKFKNYKTNKTPTKCKCHKVVIGMRRSEIRFNFSCNVAGNHLQSITALTLNR